MTTTLLDMTQQILSPMDSDEVNSIGDTIESTQVANLIKETFDDIATQYDLPSIKRTFTLESAADVNQPTKMRIPDGTFSVEWIKYNITDGSGATDRYVTITYCAPESFLTISHARDSTATEVQTVTLDENTKIYVLDNADPLYWTSFDDEFVMFDAFDSAVDTTIQASKTMAFGQTIPALVLADATVIDLPDELISLLRNEVRSMAFDLWKDGTTPKIDQAAERARIRAQRSKRKFRVNQERTAATPDYGRRVIR